jgi:RimJ/RimL family protein N-acetyltransferase
MVVLLQSQLKRRWGAGRAKASRSLVAPTGLVDHRRAMEPQESPIWLPTSLTDGVIVLDAHTLADAEAHWRGEDDEMRQRFDAPRAATLEEIHAALGRWIEARAAGGPNFVYALRLPDGPLMGGCEIRRLGPGRANVSYWVFPDFRGRGYAARALRLLCAAAAKLADVRQLEAHIDPDNLASRRVAEAAGFTETGSVEDETWAGELSMRVLYVWIIGAG